MCGFVRITGVFYKLLSNTILGIGDYYQYYLHINAFDIIFVLFWPSLLLFFYRCFEYYSYMMGVPQYFNLYCINSL